MTIHYLCEHKNHSTYLDLIEFDDKFLNDIEDGIFIAKIN